MPDKPDTGLCPQCGRRKPLDKYGNIVFHRQGAGGRFRCMGTRNAPVEGSVLLGADTMEGVSLTRNAYVAHMNMKIIEGAPETEVDMLRAIKTRDCLRDDKPFDSAVLNSLL